jgi:predicted histone-like DNA-binding protein
MPIFYNKVQKSHPQNPQKPRLWYPVIKSTKMVREKDLAAMLAKEIALTPNEVEATIHKLFDVVKTLITTGHTVQLGELGSFRTTATTEGSATEAEADESKIIRLNVRFTESNELKNAMRQVSFVEWESLFQ